MLIIFFISLALSNLILLIIIEIVFSGDVLKDNYSGSIREMLSIALPMVVSNACETVMVFFTDRLFLSKLGMEEMSAAMAGGISAFFL